jgi:hypothetical protein
MLVLRATATRRPRMANTSISCASSVRPPGEAVVMRPHNDCLVIGHYGLDSIDRLAPPHSPRPAKNFPNTALPMKVLASRL